MNKMKNVYVQAQDLLNAIFGKCDFDLHSTAIERETGIVLDIDGADASLLRSESGELLESLQHLLNQAFSRSLEQGERLVCDVHGFRAMREAELRAMAHHAAERVRTSGVPFLFSAMSSNERRVIHLSLSNEADLHTESVGEGNARRLKVSLRHSN